MLRYAELGERHSRIKKWAELRVPPGCTAERFESVVERLKAYATSGESVLAILGPRGVGKTQLAALMVRDAINQDKVGRVATVVEIMADLKSRYDRNGGDSDWLRAWRSPWLLVIDEFHEQAGTDHTRLMLTALIDRRYRDCKPTVLIANQTADDFSETAGASIASRCTEGGGVVLCNWGTMRGASE